MNTRVLLVPLMCSVVLGAGCDEKGNPLLFDLPNTVTGVAVTPDTRTAFVGEVVQFTATVNVQGNVPDRSVTWNSSVPSVASVDATGRVTMLAPGVTHIAARANADTSKQDSSELTVVTPVPIIFNISATKTIDTGCNFSASFTGKLEAMGSSDGMNLTIRMIERLTRTYQGAVNATGAFSASGSGNLDGFLYSGTIAGLATATTVQGTETLNFTTGCPGRQVVYEFSGSR